MYDMISSESRFRINREDVRRVKPQELKETLLTWIHRSRQSHETRFWTVLKSLMSSNFRTFCLKLQRVSTLWKSVTLWITDCSHGQDREILILKCSLCREYSQKEYRPSYGLAPVNCDFQNSVFSALGFKINQRLLKVRFLAKCHCWSFLCHVIRALAAAQKAWAPVATRLSISR